MPVSGIGAGGPGSVVAALKARRSVLLPQSQRANDQIDRQRPVVRDCYCWWLPNHGHSLAETEMRRWPAFYLSSGLLSRSGSLAMFAAMRRASSRA
jgi:hypothetical protein